MEPRAADIARWWQLAPVGQVVIDDQGYILQVNHTLSDWLSQPASQLINQLASSLFTVESRMLYQGVMAFRLTDVGAVDEVHLCLHLDNERILPVLCSARRLSTKETPLTLISMLPISRKDQLERDLLDARKEAQQALSEKSEVIAELESMRTILESRNSELHRLTMKLGHEARSDPLTGLPNRRHFDLALQERLAGADAYRHSNDFSVAILDIDHFKPINDQHGHAAGDQVLQALAQLLSSQLRGNDFVARIGGEEFALLLPDTSIDEAVGALERLRCAIEVHHWEPVPIIASFGVTSYLPGDTCESLMARADSALYVTKRQGRNHVTQS
ncbi:GGDEF domain-containing protein [Vreelandella arcis]|uniref:diguanylate cyclase n=1 Tax=Vreelandella arcis TaxID=416873 RepID=A0A1G9XQ79_9GAMM|nr:sensor domain-containing diguanylate cyclase [Halomonas arcis]SDM98345.1 diguanylate cyclase (GGDEF) domain-containing protein [Halomonas arcis]